MTDLDVLIARVIAAADRVQDVSAHRDISDRDAVALRTADDVLEAGGRARRWAESTVRDIDFRRAPDLRAYVEDLREAKAAIDALFRTAATDPTLAAQLRDLDAILAAMGEEGAAPMTDLLRKRRAGFDRELGACIKVLGVLDSTTRSTRGSR